MTRACSAMRFQRSYLRIDRGATEESYVVDGGTLKLNVAKGAVTVDADDLFAFILGKN